MSYDFFSCKTVVGKKPHVCEQCRSAIDAGESHYYSAGKFEGDFTAYREHLDCHAAWIALHELRETRWDDTHPFIADDDEIDAGEREWLQEKHPSVVKRLGWKVAAITPVSRVRENTPNPAERIREDVE